MTNCCVSVVQPAPVVITATCRDRSVTVTAAQQGPPGPPGGAGGSLTVIEVTASQSAEVGRFYYCDSPSIIQLALPTVANSGDRFSVVNSGAGTVQITQSAGQQVTVGDTKTTVGVTGRIDSFVQGDWLDFAYVAGVWVCTINTGYTDVI